MTYEYNRALKIFSQLYVGIRDLREKETVPLAFATPYEDNAAGRKRQSSVDDWVSSGSRTYDWITKVETKGKCEKRIIDNKPRSGFRITDSVKRVYWGGGNVVFRVQDPDGWEVEIQGANLMALIDQVGFQEGGVVPGKCVWARDGAHNILLPITSKEYKDSIKGAESHVSAKIAMKDRVVGHHYILQDGTPCQYLGKIWIHSEHDATLLSSNISVKFFAGNGLMLTNPVMPANGGRLRLSQSSVQYEAVMTNTMSSDGTTEIKNVRLYKTASLVKFLKEDKLDKTPAEIANSTTMAFASSSAEGKPIFAAMTKDADPVYRKQPWSAAEIEEAFVQVDHFVNHRSSGGGKFTLEDAMRFSYPAQNCVVKLNGAYYASPQVVEVVKIGSPKRPHYNIYEDVASMAVMAPFYIDDKTIGCVRPVHNYSQLHSQSDLSYFRHQSYDMDNSHETVTSPTFDTIEELKQYCLDKAAKCELFRMVVKSS